jgi:hypothetical protein
MLMFVSHYHGTFSLSEVQAASEGTAAFAVANGDFDYTYYK